MTFQNIQPSKEQERMLGSCVAPLVWGKADGSTKYLNGTMTFFNSGDLIGITNAHVYHALINKIATEGGITLLLSIKFDLSERLVECNDELDLATFNIKPEELDQIAKIAAVQAEPYSLAKEDMCVFVSGYPGELRINNPTDVGCLAMYYSGARILRVNPRIVVVDTRIYEDTKIEEFAAKYRQLDTLGGISGAGVLGIATRDSQELPLLLGIVFEEVKMENSMRARPISCIGQNGNISFPQG